MYKADVETSAEIDPTVDSDVKDRVSWDGVGDKPAGFADNIDNTDDADADPTNEFNATVSLIGTTLEITDAGGTKSVELAGLQDGVNNADADPTNEPNILVALNGTTIEITDKGETKSVDLAGLQDGVNDAVDSSGLDNLCSTDNKILKRISGTWVCANDLTISDGADNDWIISGDDMYSGLSGNVGIGTTSPSEKLEVNGTIKATSFVSDGSGLTGINGETNDTYTTICWRAHYNCTPRACRDGYIDDGAICYATDWTNCPSCNRLCERVCYK